MSDQSFTTTLAVDEAPDVVFDAINDPRGWWSGEFEGETDRLGAEFTYRYRDMHRSKQVVTELVPATRVVWHVADAELSFAKDPTEWTGTNIVFDIVPSANGTEVRFTHLGLAPRHDCYDSCSTAWTSLIHNNLRRRIATGEAQADVLS